MTDKTPDTVAGRLAMITELLNPPIYGLNEFGEQVIIGYGPPVISEADALRLLNLVESDKK